MRDFNYPLKPKINNSQVGILQEALKEFVY